MTDQRLEAFRLESEFVHLENDGKLTGLPVGDNFWSEASSRGHLQSGRLMGVLKIDPGPSHWEMHPDGDEFLYLLSGSMDVAFESESKNEVINLAGFSSCIVPRGTWHQTIAREPCNLLFITPGKGTRHRNK
jgi:mannose-6-phosphate isomerase-like protein (cupin superfamily)